MKHHILYSLCIITSITIISCSKSQKEPYRLPKKSVELISGTNDKGKTWKLARRYNNGTRMNMAGCFLSYRITYQSNMTLKDNNGEQDNCGPSLLANWEITKDKKGNSYLKYSSDQLPELMNMKKNYKYFKILQLSQDTLKIQFRHKQFSSKSTFIDIFVTENTKVKDRDFHW
ncbi:lipocalin family protein [Aquimarina sp. AU474]|uniref:lipocalin family protein n=1 Tax=Aquimarina sp. AU474 TaxID=2108529 RepID=UPI000D688B65|nr:lipocalin family protein [Aquimarina sp. AU474]